MEYEEWESSFFKQYPDITVEQYYTIKDPIEAARLLQKDTKYILLIEPSILTREMVFYVLSNGIENSNYIKVEQNETLFRSILLELVVKHPTICEFMSLQTILTMDALHALQYRQHKDVVHEAIDAITGPVYINALCRGAIIGKNVQLQRIHRGWMDEVNSSMKARIHATINVDNFVEHKNKSMDDKIFKGDAIDFLDVITPKGTFNLFSIRTEWTLTELNKLFEGKEIFLADYSSNRVLNKTRRRINKTIRYGRIK